MLRGLVDDVVARGQLDAAPYRFVHLTSMWEGRAVLVVFASGRAHPDLILKVDRSSAGARRLEQEHAALRWLVEGQVAPGAVPAPIGLFEHRGATVLAQRAVPGTPLTTLIRQRMRLSARRLERDHAAALRWLDRFRSPTLREPDPTSATPDADAVELAAQLLPTDELWAQRAIDRLDRAVDVVGAIRSPVSWSHGDLGPSNMLLSGDQIGVVDWEGAHREAPAVNDVVIMLHHYARAVCRRRASGVDKHDVMALVFLGDDVLARQTRRRWREQLSALRLPADADGLILASTALRFAAGDTPFAHQVRGRRMWTEISRRFLRAWSGNATGGRLVAS